jgi:hypothetical protein
MILSLTSDAFFLISLPFSVSSITNVIANSICDADIVFCDPNDMYRTEFTGFESS